jgi:NADH-quinone oxidoreductase subunit M
VILAALYLLWAYQRVFHGPAEGDNATFRDLRVWEVAVMLPLLAGIFFLGIYPKPVLERIEPSVDVLIDHIEQHSDFREPAPVEPPEGDVVAEEGHG